MPEPKAKDAPVEEKKDTKPVETPTEDKKEVKAGDVLDTKKEKSEDPKMVPEAVLIEIKKENKELAKELKDLKKQIEEGASKKEVSADLKDLAKKHNVDADFLEDFANNVRKQAKEASEEELRPIKEKEISEKREKTFNEFFDKTLEEMPEYSKLVNKDVIRTLAFDPKNANKTFAQIFESAYGHLVTGKKTLETTKPRGGQDGAKVDIERARKDEKYLAEVLADPELKKEYNASIHLRIGM